LIEVANRSGLPSPELDARNLPFQTGAAQGKLLLPRCNSCGHLMAPPVANCSKCLSEDFSWEEASGQGTVFSFIVYHRAWVKEFEPHIPYAVAIVSLAEGPRLVTNIVTPNLALLTIGAPVQAVFERRDDENSVPVFVLAQEVVGALAGRPR
jgi:uncharacterized OB-fold protein